MAIFHLHARTAKKGKQSAAAASSYIRREGAYRHGGGLVASGSGNLPAWAETPGAFWAAADQHERANGRLFKSIEASLPRELSRGRQLALIRAFCERVAMTADGPLPYSYAVHDSDGKNPHMHMMISERVTDGLDRGPEGHFRRAAPKGADPATGGARKTETLKPRQWLEDMRKLWAEMSNAALAAAGSEERIDHRSLDAQGSCMTPSMHLGPTATAMVAKGKSGPRLERWKKRETERKEEKADMDRTRAAVQRQIEAMDCELYQIGIFDPDKGMMMREWDYEMLLKSIDYLKRMNALGNEIYIRPAASTDAALILLDDLPASTALTLQADGLAPACITETSPGNFQAWIRISETPVNSAIRGTIARRLADELGADKASAEKRHFGRLAGFTNRKPKRTLPNGHHPFVLCHRSDGVVAARGADLIRDAEKALSEKKLASEKKSVSEPRVAQAPLSKTHAAPPRPRVRLDAGMAFRDHWREWEAQGGTDKSAGDFAVACRMVWEGYGSYEIERAMAANSPDIEARKPRGYVGAYCIATVEKAREAVRPRDADSRESETEDRGPRPGY